MPPGPTGGPPATRPFIIAAIPTQVIHGLCSIPAQVSAAEAAAGTKDTVDLTERESRVRREHQPHAAGDDVEGPVGSVDGGRVEDRDLDVPERRRSAAERRRPCPGAMSLMTTRPVGPTSSDQRRAQRARTCRELEHPISRPNPGRLNQGLGCGD